jgi:hypothetical protein
LCLLDHDPVQRPHRAAGEDRARDAPLMRAQPEKSVLSEAPVTGVGLVRAPAFATSRPRPGRARARGSA